MGARDEVEVKMNRLVTISCWLNSVNFEVGNLLDDLRGCDDNRLDYLETLCDRAKMRAHLMDLATGTGRITNVLKDIAGDDDQLDIIIAEFRDTVKACARSNQFGGGHDSHGPPLQLTLYQKGRVVMTDESILQQLADRMVVPLAAFNCSCECVYNGCYLAYVLNIKRGSVDYGIGDICVRDNVHLCFQYFHAGKFYELHGWYPEQPDDTVTEEFELCDPESIDRLINRVVQLCRLDI